MMCETCRKREDEVFVPDWNAQERELHCDNCGWPLVDSDYRTIE